MPSWAKITSRLAVTPASDSSVLVRWRLSCWAPSGMVVEVRAAARTAAMEKFGRQRPIRARRAQRRDNRCRSPGASGSEMAIRGT